MCLKSPKNQENNLQNLFQGFAKTVFIYSVFLHIIQWTMLSLRSHQSWAAADNSSIINIRGLDIASLCNKNENLRNTLTDLPLLVYFLQVSYDQILVWYTFGFSSSHRRMQRNVSNRSEIEIKSILYSSSKKYGQVQ